jgi:hypothetical protein
MQRLSTEIRGYALIIEALDNPALYIRLSLLCWRGIQYKLK